MFNKLPKFHTIGGLKVSDAIGQGVQKHWGERTASAICHINL